MFSHKSLLLAAILLLAATPLAAQLADPADCPADAFGGCAIVDDDNCPGPGSGTLADPYCSIQFAYDLFVTTTEPDGPDCPGTPGDCRTITLLIKPGTYTECINASGFIGVAVNDRPVRIVADHWLLNGEVGPNDTEFDSVVGMTTLDGLGVCDPLSGSRAPVLTVGGTGASVQGFTITNGGRSGVSGRGGVAISNNLITANGSSLGGGVYFNTLTCFYFGPSNATISNNKILGNASDDFEEIGLGDGGGIGIVAEGSETAPFCAGGTSEVTVADNLIQNNSATNLNLNVFTPDLVAAGGGIWVQGVTFNPFGPPEDSATKVVITRNVISDNTVNGATAAACPSPDLLCGGFGGGIWANTFGYGQETIHILDNTVGPNNSATTNGGGITGWATGIFLAVHELLIDNNDVTENTADSGGGMDLLLDAVDVAINQKMVLSVTNNDIVDNSAVRDGGGIFSEFNSTRTVDVADGTTHPSPTAELTFLIRGNTILDNFAGLGAGGVLMLPRADSDPDFNPPTIDCTFAQGTQRPANATIDFESNLVGGNIARNFDPVESGDIIGAGVLVLPDALGESTAAVVISTSTIAGNTFDPIGQGAYVGGIEVAGVTEADCDVSHFGVAPISVSNTIVEANHGDGIGGPPPDPGQTVSVTKTLVHGSGDSLSFNDPDLDYEDTLFPGGAPTGNFRTATDPQLDPVTYALPLCSTIFEVGSCETDSMVVCFDDADCAVACDFEGAGHLFNPDSNYDGVVDGLDILKLAVSFDSDESEPRFDKNRDLNRNGVVDGDDLALMSPEFSMVCVP